MKNSQIIKIRKILLVFPKYSSFYTPIRKSLDELGIKYDLFDQRKSSYLEKLIFVLSKLDISLLQKKQILLNKRLEKKVTTYKPDLVLVVKGENLLPKTIKSIRKKTIIVNWFSDYFRWFREMENWIQAYSFIFTGDQLDVNESRKKGFNNVFLLPLAGLKHIRFGEKRDLEIAFIGTYTKKREEMFYQLKDFQFKIWGDKKWKVSSLKKQYMGQWLSYEDTLDIYKNSKIVINLHNETMGKNRFLNMRIFEATSCGALLITDYKKDILQFFIPNKEVILFKNKRDLFNKIKYYLKNNEERKRIALGGYKRLNKDHTFNLRLKKMFSIINTYSQS